MTEKFEFNATGIGKLLYDNGWLVTKLVNCQGDFSQKSGFDRSHALSVYADKGDFHISISARYDAGDSKTDEEREYNRIEVKLWGEPLGMNLQGYSKLANMADLRKMIEDPFGFLEGPERYQMILKEELNKVKSQARNSNRKFTSSD